VNHIHSAITEILQQGMELLGSITNEQYIQPHPFANNASIGKHYRHCLEHFEPLFQTDNNDLIDYDARKRDPLIETNLTAASDRTYQIISLCGQVTTKSLDQDVRVRCKVAYIDTDEPAVKSTRAREWMYGIAHAIHHYAIISILCRMQNIELSPSFGVAPSTKQYLKVQYLSLASNG
jgi:hypothetical protein